MKKEFYQSTFDFCTRKAIAVDSSYASLYWNLDGVISCAAQDNEINIDDFIFLMAYKNTILKDYKK